MTIHQYVVGFAMDLNGRVVLIRKEHPEWQRGLLNGVGGSVEPGESPNEAMVREFREETGVTLEGWEWYLTIHAGADVHIHFYRIQNLDSSITDQVRTTTDEEVSLVDMESLDRMPYWAVPNLSWTLPLARYQADVYRPIHVWSEKK